MSYMFWARHFLFVGFIMIVCFLFSYQDNSPPLPIRRQSSVKQNSPSSNNQVSTLICPTDMISIDGRFCIDQYESPNEKGEFPYVCSSAVDAESYCQSMNKRLCDIDEWKTACQGSSEKFCNDHKIGWKEVPWMSMYDEKVWDQFCWSSYKADRSGSNQECKSNYEIYDMLGNVSEWVKMPKGKYGYAMTGGYWYGSLQGAVSCSTTNQAHGKTFNTYEAGIRCCKDIQ
jgi:formylglycine-generating enzyme